MRHCHHHHHHHGAVRDARVHVHLLLGERRIVVQRVHNDSEQPLELTPALSVMKDVTAGTDLATTPMSVAPATPTTIAPGAATNLRYTLDTTGLLRGHVYRVEVRFEDTFVPALVFAIFVEAEEPLVSRHDPSRVRAWLRGHCFGHDRLRWFAPATRAACHGHAHAHPGHCHGHV